MLKFIVAACLCAAVLVEGRSLLADDEAGGPPEGSPDGPPGPPPKKMEHSRLVRQAPSGDSMPGAQGMAGMSGGFGGSLNFGGLPGMMSDFTKIAGDMMQQMIPPRGKRSAQMPIPELPPMPPMPPIPN